MHQNRQWHQIVEGSLKELRCFLINSRWRGRENEVVNLFAHRFLWSHLGEGPFIDPSQIGIEVAVEQIPKAGAKKLVRKDLVLWNKPLETVWGTEKEFNAPAVIMEWKADKIDKCAIDMRWLQAFTRLNPEVLGYSVCALLEKERRISFSRVSRGKVESDTHHIIL
jgi:hypothetical protein